ncbi:VanZ family protein [Sporosarcina sp. Te-1]|uniref:VanZ family protein n=1 Tax=Sporosarcina sp. Te-1 TaxID=2818390 RepID=UPI001A9EF8F5|nr:VanZ family protein [Sporosarcina sp. Te-1]QTD40820.1 VanZ family protein [Sporosarcina sp. Te-1]
MRKYLFVLVILLLLFFSSGQTYEQQTIVPTLKQWLPNKPLEGILSLLQIPYWGITVSVEERGYYYFVEFLLRKAAHFFTFGLLAVSVYYVLPASRFRIFFALLGTTIFAIVDEYHQSLTGGRTASVYDVLLDTAGAFTCLMILRLAQFVRSIMCKQRKPRYP